eukprot:snap_masked-scaffold_4-processed-gene-8.6-mRNA-1 protein AED:1.00 eAED:1.00 QI:0/0/0/0/1/1/2/0/74
MFSSVALKLLHVVGSTSRRCLRHLTYNNIDFDAIFISEVLPSEKNPVYFLLPFTCTKIDFTKGTLDDHINMTRR